MSDGPTILVLQHIACEPPGAYEDVMLERGARLHRVELDEGEPLPDWREFDGMVVMGGPMGACDDADHPWLVAERSCIGEAVRAGLPFFGACLGSQLLAASLGARVYTGATPEVGVLDVELTDAGRDDPVLGDLPASFPTLQWHSDSFDLPEGAVGLASSPAYANQAFRVGDAAYAVQFHVEVTSEMAAEWARGARLRASARAGPRPGRARRAAGGVRGAPRGDDRPRAHDVLQLARAGRGAAQ